MTHRSAKRVVLTSARSVDFGDNGSIRLGMANMPPTDALLVQFDSVAGLEETHP